jgi:hypothetical protein
LSLPSYYSSKYGQLLPIGREKNKEKADPPKEPPIDAYHFSIHRAKIMIIYSLIIMKAKAFPNAIFFQRSNNINT